MKEFFKKKALPYALTAAMAGAVSVPAVASKGFPKINLSEYNSADVEKWVEGGCKGQCADKLVIVTYSSVETDKAFARAGFNASKRLHDEGFPVFYVMASDNNDNIQDAVMMPYVNGQREDGIKLEVGYGLISERAIKFHNTENSMYNQARLVYEQYLQASVSPSQNAVGTLTIDDGQNVPPTLAIQ